MYCHGKSLVSYSVHEYFTSDSYCHRDDCHAWCPCTGTVFNGAWWKFQCEAFKQIDACTGDPAIRGNHVTGSTVPFLIKINPTCINLLGLPTIPWNIKTNGQEYVCQVLRWRAPSHCSIPARNLTSSVTQLVFAPARLVLSDSIQDGSLACSERPKVRWLPLE